MEIKQKENGKNLEGVKIMLTAIREDGVKVYADEVYRKDGDKYYCPECGSELILRQGTKNIWHFSHKEDNGICVFRKYENESLPHKLMKKTIKEIVEEYNECVVSELEHKVSSKIADYYFEVKKFGNIKRVVVECVQTHTDIDVFRAKNEYYARQGVYVIWLFNITRFLNKDNSFKEVIRTNEILKECHTMYYGKVYAVDIVNKVCYGIHFDKIVRETDFTTLYDEYGEEYTVGGGSYTLKSDRTLMPVLIKEFIVSSFKKAWDEKSLRFLPYRRNVANVYMKSWW